MIFSADDEVRFSAGIQVPEHFAETVSAVGSVSEKQTAQADSVSEAGDNWTVRTVSAAAVAARRQTDFAEAVSVPMPADDTGNLQGHCRSVNNFPAPDGSAVHSRREHSVEDAVPEDNRPVHNYFARSRSEDMTAEGSHFADNHSGDIRSEDNRFEDTHSVLPVAVPVQRSAAVYHTDP